MRYERMPIEIESPEEYGYDKIKNNLSESSVTDASLKTLELQIPDLILLYNEHRGNTGLRQLIAKDAEVEHNDVLITSGAAGALFIIATSQLGPGVIGQPGGSQVAGKHLVVVRPNYATNLETPKAIGCDVSHMEVTFETGFQPDLDAIASSIKSSTRMVSVTCPHNPTGTSMSLKALKQLVTLTKERNVLLLVDETYRDISYVDKLPVAASLGDHVISVSSLSKSFGMPGLRIGWIITRNKALHETFLAAKEQISISCSVIDEWVAEQVLSKREEILSRTQKEMSERLLIVEAWIEGEDAVEWVKPTGGVVCFPRIKKDPPGGWNNFYQRLLSEYGTCVGPGHWFGLPDNYFRLGYGWPTRDELTAGMNAISSALKDL